MNYLKLIFYFYNTRKQNLRIRESNRWKKAFLYFLCHIRRESSDYTGRWDVIKGFAKCNIRILKKAVGNLENDAPILICVVLNEKERIDVFLNHYRKIGIKRFAIIDNGSTDGTVDYLKAQSDVELFQIKVKFESKIKVGWINRIISYYGTNYWYLVVDADELIVWQGVEKINIQKILIYLEKRNITRARALMIDMYSKEIKWNTDETFEEIYPDCRYFDHDTYYHKKSKELYLICGGPRKRKLGIEAWLTKYPLFKLKENDFFCNPHVLYPYENKRTPCYLALLHYKFLTNTDKRKMQKYARAGNYARNSAEYKKYLQKQREDINNFNFYFEKSLLYQSSESLERIGQIEKLSNL